MANISNDERQRVPHEWNDTHRSYRLDRCLHELIEEQVLRRSHRGVV
jgi:hypothetical protein